MSALMYKAINESAANPANASSDCYCEGWHVELAIGIWSSVSGL